LSLWTRSEELVRKQLEKILASDGFARNERLSGFLRFVVEQEINAVSNTARRELHGGGAQAAPRGILS
jgi:hypothetical protein